MTTDGYIEHLEHLWESTMNKWVLAECQQCEWMEAYRDAAGAAMAAQYHSRRENHPRFSIITYADVTARQHRAIEAIERAESAGA